MIDRIPMLWLVLVVGCAAGDSSDNISGGQPFDPMGDTSAASASESETSAPPVETSSSASASGEESSSGPGSTSSQEPTSDCCTPAAAPGCTVPETETCVCSIRPACCEDAWSVECAGIAVDGCGSACGESSMSAGEATSDDTPTVSCGELGRMEGFIVGACETDGNGACGGRGTPTSDCDFCCDVCDSGLTCGQLAQQQSWEFANCESNGNNACNGTGTPTCDCDFCCEVVL